jgi:hypothetical protein
MKGDFENADTVHHNYFTAVRDRADVHAMRFMVCVLPPCQEMGKGA